MNTIIRTHVRDKARLDLLERNFKSFYDKGLNELGGLVVLDDCSPMRNDVANLCDKYKSAYFLATGNPDTKHGLAESLRVSQKLNPDGIDFMVTDDIVYGKGIKERIEKILSYDQYAVGRYGLIGMFACYENDTRKPNKISSADLWNYKPCLFYALMCHFFEPNFRKMVLERWDNILAGKTYYPRTQDDIWIRDLCDEFGYLPIYSTMLDYVQHTGMGKRSFEFDQFASTYMSKMFVGE